MYSQVLCMFNKIFLTKLEKNRLGFHGFFVASSNSRKYPNWLCRNSVALSSNIQDVASSNIPIKLNSILTFAADNLQQIANSESLGKSQRLKFSRSNNKILLKIYIQICLHLNDSPLYNFVRASTCQLFHFEFKNFYNKIRRQKVSERVSRSKKFLKRQKLKFLLDIIWNSTSIIRRSVRWRPASTLVTNYFIKSSVDAFSNRLHIVQGFALLNSVSFRLKSKVCQLSRAMKKILQKMFSFQIGRRSLGHNNMIRRKSLHWSRLETFKRACFVSRRWRLTSLWRLPLMIFLETRHDAQVSLTLRAMIFRLSSKNPSMGVDRVPAEVAT